MKIMNVELEPLYKFLFSLELQGKYSRMRTRFLKLLQDRIQEIYNFQNELLNKYGQRDEEGSLKMEAVEEKTIYQISNVQEYNAEIRELMLEEFVIDETLERKDILLTVKHLILNSDEVFSGKEALEYDRWCEIFEAISYKE